MQQAYADLYQRLDDNNDSEALALLKHLMNCVTSGGAMDEPSAVSGRPGAAQSPGAMTMDERAAFGATVRAGRARAQQFLFNQRFPGAARIRSVG